MEVFIVGRDFGDDLEIVAEDYEVDEEGHLVFVDEDDMEIGRVAAGRWDNVFQVANVEDDGEADVEDE